MPDLQDIAEVTLSDLQDSARLLAWLTDRFDFCGLPPSRFLLARGLAAAMRATANGADPPKLFLTLVSRGLRDGWSFLTAEQIKGGELRLAELPEISR